MSLGVPVLIGRFRQDIQRSQHTTEALRKGRPAGLFSCHSDGVVFNGATVCRAGGSEARVREPWLPVFVCIGEEKSAIKVEELLFPLLQQAGIEPMQRVILTGAAISFVEGLEVPLAIVVFLDLVRQVWHWLLA